jgi:hypothetical protein
MTMKMNAFKLIGSLVVIGIAGAVLSWSSSFVLNRVRAFIPPDYLYFTCIGAVAAGVYFVGWNQENVTRGRRILGFITLIISAWLAFGLFQTRSGVPHPWQRF